MAEEVPWHRRAKPSRGEEEPYGDTSGVADTADEDCLSMTECLPGVPDDVILEILARTPREATPALRAVSRAWRRAATSPLLRACRKAQGRLEQWLFVLPALPKGGPFRAFDSLSATWHTLPPLLPSPALKTGDSSGHTPQSTPQCLAQGVPLGIPRHTYSPSPTHPSSHSLIHSHTHSHSHSHSHSQSQSQSPSDSPGHSYSPSDSLKSSPSPSLSGSGSPCQALEGEGRVQAVEGFACASVAGKLLAIGGSERSPPSLAPLPSQVSNGS